MNYFIKRELNEYGPYSLADLQKYVASGNVLLTDLCRSEGLTDWVPVSQVLGNIPVPVAAPAPQPVAGTVYGGQPAYGGPAGYAAPTSPQFPPPPSLHWGLCLLLSIITCGIFGWVWSFIQAVWIRKVLPSSKTLYYFSAALALNLLAIIVAYSLAFSMRDNPSLAPTLAGVRLLNVVVWVLLIVGWFDMRSSIEEHYNTAEPIGLSLSAVITFLMSFILLGHIYFQFHFTRINEMKRAQMGGYPR